MICIKLVEVSNKSQFDPSAPENGATRILQLTLVSPQKS